MAVIVVLLFSGRLAMDKASSLVSTRATATLSGTQQLQPRRGQVTASRARTGATLVASTRSRQMLIGRWLSAVRGWSTID